MTRGAIDRRTVRSAVELAERAPSVHNTQPWRWRLGDRSVHLYADLHRWLPATDADGRDLLVSCGAALHHLRVALAAAGARSVVHRLPDPAARDHLAAVELLPGRATDADLALAAAISRRRTDRRPFAADPLPDQVVQQLERAAADQGAILRIVTTTRARAQLLDAIREAAALQEAVPGYAAELATWSGLRASDDGVPAANLPRSTRGVEAARRFGGGDVATVYGPDGAALAVLGTASDDRLSQLRAGEALSAVLLRATELGLASCPLSQPLEIGTTRHMLRDDVLDGTLSPQLVLRLGWRPANSSLPATRRRAVQETIDPSG